MKYSTEKLIANIQAGANPEYLFFWGHRDQANGSVGKGCLSQWYPRGFEVDGQYFPTAEHWMMYQKAKLFGDKAAMEAVFKDRSPQAAKQIGRKVKNFDPQQWSENAYGFVRQGNVYKFQQSEKLRAYLLSTGSRILVEASPYDQIWGIGMHANDARAVHPEQWQGTNLLGFALMEVRDEILSNKA